MKLLLQNQSIGCWQGWGLAQNGGVGTSRNVSSEREWGEEGAGDGRQIKY